MDIKTLTKQYLTVKSEGTSHIICCTLMRLADRRVQSSCLSLKYWREPKCQGTELLLQPHEQGAIWIQKYYKYIIYINTTTQESLGFLSLAYAKHISNVTSQWHTSFTAGRTLPTPYPSRDATQITATTLSKRINYYFILRPKLT